MFNSNAEPIGAQITNYLLEKASAHFDRVKSR